MFDPQNMSRTHAVPVKRHKSVLPWIIPVDVVCYIIGIIPWFVFLQALDSPRFMTTAFYGWIALPFVLTALLLTSFQVKMKNHQPSNERITLLILTVIGFALTLVVPLNAVLYGTGIGN